MVAEVLARHCMELETHTSVGEKLSAVGEKYASHVRNLWWDVAIASPGKNQKFNQ